MANKIALEIVCTNIESVMAAQQGGADRVELCDSLAEGGTTPSSGMIEATRKKLSIPFFVMIRPRAGDFFYSPDEFDIMKRDIEVCKKLKADGVVLGILNDDGTIDKKRTKKLVDLSDPLPVTFHRAFDMTIDPVKAVEDVIECRCQRILTSGLKSSAIEGMELISQLINRAAGRIIIMPGGGIRPENVVRLIDKTKATEIHSSAKTVRSSRMNYKNNSVSMGASSSDEFNVLIADVRIIQDLKGAITSGS